MHRLPVNLSLRNDLSIVNMGVYILYPTKRFVAKRPPVHFFMKFDRTDLRRGVSGAKFDAESDFEVRLAVAPQKPDQNCEKLNFRFENFRFCFFRFIAMFSASKCRRRLKLSHLTDFDVPNSFFRSDHDHFGEKTSKNLARTSVRGVGGMRGARKLLDIQALSPPAPFEWKL